MQQTEPLRPDQLATGNASPACTKLINFARAEVAASRPFPNKEQIMAFMGWKENRPDVMMRLERAGLIKRDGYERGPGRQPRQKWRLA